MNKLSESVIYNNEEKKDKYENFKIENINEITCIREKASLDGFILLKDGRLLLLKYSTINIYNSETFELLSSQQILKNEYNRINLIHLMKNGNILPTLNSKNIYILKLNNNNKFEIVKELKGHTSIIYQVIELENENLISVSYNNTFRIWRKNNNEYFCKILFLPITEITNFYEIKNNIIVFEDLTCNCITFYDVNKI